MSSKLLIICFLSPSLLRMVFTKEARKKNITLSAHAEKITTQRSSKPKISAKEDSIFMSPPPIPACLVIRMKNFDVAKSAMSMHAERIREPPALISHPFVGVAAALHTSITQSAPKRRGTSWGIVLVLISHTVAIPITMSTPIHTHGDDRVKKSPIRPPPSLRPNLHVSEIQRTKMWLVLFGDRREFLAINTPVIPAAHKTFPRARQRC